VSISLGVYHFLVGFRSFFATMKCIWNSIKSSFVRLKEGGFDFVIKRLFLVGKCDIIQGSDFIW